MVILRQFNCYGPRETHPYIVPELIIQFQDSNTVHLGNIETSRDLTYVSDAVTGDLKLANQPRAESEVVNLGYGEDFTVEQLAHRIGDLMGYDDIEITVENKRKRPLDVEQLHCDYSKATDLIGYEPTVSLEEGLQRTIGWYEANGPWIWEQTLKYEVWDNAT